MESYDIIIVGAGIAGATLAAEAAPHASVLLLEAEDSAGYHATGRSAAFWSETYGGPTIQPLTTASHAALDAAGALTPLGALQIGRAADQPLLDAFLAKFADSGIALRPVDPHSLIPGLREDWTIAVEEPTCAYIDVARVHQQALATARRAGATLALRSPLSAARVEQGGWVVEAGGIARRGAVLVNAAGAWADDVDRLAGVTPLGITPYRRTLVQLLTDPPVPSGLPHIASLDSSFYFKPEPGGRLWLSPHDETPDIAGDVQPEQIDVAIAVDRLEHVVDWRVTKVERAWAGLRSFAPDRAPVYGFAAGHGPADMAPARAPYFYSVGQGGFGIQTAPAAAMIGAALLLQRSLPAPVAHIDIRRYAATRFPV